VTLPDGYTDVPPGKIAAVVTYLEMHAKVESRPTPATGLSLRRLGPADALDYLAVYRRIGERWMWFSRLAATPDAVAAVLARPQIQAFALQGGGADIGLLELEEQGDETEIVYFGLVDAAVGAGAGRWLMNAAVELAFERPIRRLWLHTCTLDHPGAPAFYRRSGFVPYRLAVEVADDPRLAGLLPPDSFPDIPLTRP
jgi:GNAT superfamily N-acetyltransferase